MAPSPADRDPQLEAYDIEAAARLMMRAERDNAVRAFELLTEWAAVLALRATSLAEYVGAANLVVATRVRERATSRADDADRRTPSGRRVHSKTAAAEIRAEAAQELERAMIAEETALVALAAADLAAARLTIAHMDIDGVANSSGSPGAEWDAACETAAIFHKLGSTLSKWAHVRGRAVRAKQPRGGLLPASRFTLTDLGGGRLGRETETGNAGMIGSAVEVLARWDLAEDPRAQGGAVAVSLEALRAVRRGEHTESGIGRWRASQRETWNDDDEELVWTDPEEGPGDETLAHIAEMRVRTTAFWERFGRPLEATSFTVTSSRFRLDGHIDFLSADTVWDMKVSEKTPDKADVLQLLLYWLILRDEREITHFGIWNPRLDMAWQIAVEEIAPEVVEAVKEIALRRLP